MSQKHDDVSFLLYSAKYHGFRVLFNISNIIHSVVHAE